MKYFVILCTIFICPGCAILRVAEQIKVDVEQAACLKRDDIHDLVAWVESLDGVVSPIPCHRVYDVLIHVQVDRVAILLVDMEMPMAEWWHLNDVVMAEGMDSFLLSWRDVENLSVNAYYEDKLRGLLNK